MSLTHQDVLDYKKRFDGCEYVELSREEFDVLLIVVEQSIPTCKVEEKQKPITMEELASLRAIAGQATPGPWYVNSIYKHADDQKEIIDKYGDKSPLSHTRYVESQSRCVCNTSSKTRDVEHIAAFNPDTVMRLIAAAERSIRRPIADAPRDGTYVAGCDPIGHWYACRWKGDEVNGQWLDSQGYERMLVEFIPIPGEGGV